MASRSWSQSPHVLWVTHVGLSAIRVSSCMHMRHMYNQSSLVLKVQISPKCLRTGLLRLVKFPLSIYSQHAFYPRRNFRLEHNHWCYRHISRRFGWREFKYVSFGWWLCYRQRLPQSGIEFLHCFLKNPLFLLSLPGLKLVPRWDLPCLISITVS